MIYLATLALAVCGLAAAGGWLLGYRQAGRDRLTALVDATHEPPAVRETTDPAPPGHHIPAALARTVACTICGQAPWGQCTCPADCGRPHCQGRWHTTLAGLTDDSRAFLRQLGDAR